MTECRKLLFFISAGMLKLFFLLVRCDRVIFIYASYLNITVDRSYFMTSWRMITAFFLIVNHSKSFYFSHCHNISVEIDSSYEYICTWFLPSYVRRDWIGHFLLCQSQQARRDQKQKPLRAFLLSTVVYVYWIYSKESIGRTVEPLGQKLIVKIV